MSYQKILFILKRREDYNAEKHSAKGLSTGLFNSANFMNEMLNDMGIESQIEVAVDNNCIDRLVNNYKPTVVIIEALWVVPSKFEVLTKLHPKVKWIIRLHSEMPFMAGEGMSMDWLGDYVTYPKVSIGINAPRMMREIKFYLQLKQNWSNEQAAKRVLYMPNHYPKKYLVNNIDRHKPYIDISCFGAVRPLKNHLLQAFAALEFAEQIGKKLRFHINIGRVEMQGSPVMHNLLNLFEQLHHTGHQMVGHQWVPREDFLKICRTMDVGLQCNFSETFNIVSADLISQGVPIVGSKEIPWSSRFFNADPTNSKDIIDALHRAFQMPSFNVWINQRNLTKYTSQTEKIWRDLIKDI